jgi:hypothetical protein
MSSLDLVEQSQSHTNAKLVKRVASQEINVKLLIAMKEKLELYANVPLKNVMMEEAVPKTVVTKNWDASTDIEFQKIALKEENVNMTLIVSNLHLIENFLNNVSKQLVIREEVLVWLFLKIDHASVFINVKESVSLKFWVVKLQNVFLIAKEIMFAKENKRIVTMEKNVLLIYVLMELVHIHSVNHQNVSVNVAKTKNVNTGEKKLWD